MNKKASITAVAAALALAAGITTAFASSAAAPEAVKADETEISGLAVFVDAMPEPEDKEDSKTDQVESAAVISRWTGIEWNDNAGW
ncbi:hypothetical protein MCG98_17140 [Ruminococcus sp. OA3]|uniref:hypothetical protein n=1 Tax=Ruminococcus sp. OA3 TaxID=2914164 RepID=UPI001F06DF46|nr:hypothetical protein [Ruminococcus sp. OA3]MCH1984295.1 hypothetical protein [Ruminococcus sp. OA3]